MKNWSGNEANLPLECNLLTTLSSLAIFIAYTFKAKLYRCSHGHKHLYLVKSCFYNKIMIVNVKVNVKCEQECEGHSQLS